MRSFILNKLVRDNILDDMQALGQQVTFHKLNDTEYIKELSRKLLEETKEFKPENSEDALKELADVLEVIEALTDELGADFDKLRAIQSERKTKRGAFAKRIFIERLDLADDDPWADYYAAEPDRFTEVKS